MVIKNTLPNNAMDGNMPVEFKKNPNYISYMH